MTGTRPRLLIVITGLGNGGAERQVVYLARGLQARGWEVHLLSLLKPEASRLVGELRASGIALSSLGARQTGPSGLLRLVFACQRTFRSFRPDAVIGWMVHAALLARVLGAINAVPVMMTSLRTLRSNALWHDKLLAMTDRLTAGVVTNARLSAEAQVREGVTRAAKSKVIHNGLDLEAFDRLRTHAKMEFSPPSATFRWLALGRLEFEKDYPLLIEALSLVPAGPWHLSIAGDGRLRQDIEQQIQTLKLQDRITFLGQRDDVPVLLSEVDAVVMSSVVEGLPNALIEAHAAGVPVVSTAVGGVEEVVMEGVSGFLVRSRAPADLAAAMQRMMALSVEQRQAMGLAARRHVTENFGLDRMIDQWHELLCQAASRKEN